MFLFRSSSRLVVNEVPVINEPQSGTGHSRPRRSFSTVKRCLREPLFHFLLIGLVLFGVYAYLNRGRSGTHSSKEIVLSLDELRTMTAYFQSPVAASANSTGISGRGRGQGQGRGPVS